MQARIPNMLRKFVKPVLIISLIAAAIIAWPRLDHWADRILIATGARQSEEEAAEDAPPAGEVDHLELSEQALRNLGLTSDSIRPIQLETFQRSITIPAAIVERPGRTRIEVAAPMTGIVTYVHAVRGTAVEPGRLLFQLRLTHEDLVQVQTDFLKTLGELDVEVREIARLEDVTRSGAVAGIRLLEREYERDRLQALLSAQREGLRLHGLTTEQVDQIAEERRLLSVLDLRVPLPDDESASPEIRQTSLLDEQSRPLVLQDLPVHQGEAVTAGQTMCVLADYSRLYVEGLAFERDSSDLAAAARNGWRVDAVFDDASNDFQIVEDLEIAYLANEVDAESRTLRVYVDLPNRPVSESTDADGNRFLTWEYRPGRRLQLRVPVEEWQDQIVLPVDAVAKEGVEYFVFVQNGRHFDRVPVHVKYRDQFSVVIANDGALFPGTFVATRSAHQMQMALKNQAGGAVDPHAGHSH